MKRVAVTGGLACGKSSVCRFLEEMGSFVISADNIVHELFSHNRHTQEAVIGLLGKRVVKGNEIDRSEVAKQVFAHPHLLRELEQILHPQVEMEMRRQYQLCCMDHAHVLFVVEVPLLFEANLESFFDCTVAVVSDEELSASRYKGSDYEARMARQLSGAQKASRADYVIRNSGTLAQLQDETRKLFKKLIQE